MSNRPEFKRRPGEAGIYIDFTDVERTNPSEYGSQVLMLHDVSDKLYTALSKVPFHSIKSAFERRNLLNGIVFRRWEKGVVLVVFAEFEEAVNNLWKAVSDGKVEAVLIQLLKTPQLLSAIGAKKLQLRVRAWKDEVDVCRLEIGGLKVKALPLKELENDIGELQEIRRYQRDHLADKIQEVRDHCIKMQENFQPMCISVKQVLPMGTLALKSLNEFMIYSKKVSLSKPTQAPPFKVYFAAREKITETIGDIQVNICHRLAQVHGFTETANQRELKQAMKDELQEALERLEPDYDWRQFKHPDWVQKIVNREHGLFLGLASVVSAGMNTIVEVDQQVDEYFSGITGVKIEVP